MSIVPGRLRGVHVLFVDDNFDTVEIMTTCLRLNGAHVETAASGAEALSLLQTARPHVIVSDLSMPGMTGIEFIQQVRKLPREDEHPTPAIAFTAYSEKREAALAAGFQAYVMKPLDPDLMVAEVVRLLG
jgi:CheY-like chemotaxis protein